MSRYIEQFPEEIIIKVLRAYLVSGESHRSIQKNILGLPAPARGGGFVAMDILHTYGVKGEHKGIFENQENCNVEFDFSSDVIRKINEFNLLEGLANKALIEGDISSFDKIQVTEVTRITKQRIGQAALRNLVLKNYSNTCALCSISQDDLLICSHIIPWNIDEKNRLNPSNTILFCSLHDSLFDKGYYSLTDEYLIVLSDKADSVLSEILESAVFREPIDSKPNTKFLKFHREIICQSKK